ILDRRVGEVRSGGWTKAGSLSRMRLPHTHPSQGAGHAIVAPAHPVGHRLRRHPPQAGPGLLRRRGHRGRPLLLPAGRSRRHGGGPGDALLLGRRRWAGGSGLRRLPGPAGRVGAAYRRVTDGQVREGGLSDYLVLLSVYQTCKYRGVSFLKFLLSREEDVEAYCRRGRQKKRLGAIEVYPTGFSRGGVRKKSHRGTKARGSRIEVEARGRTVAIGDIHGCPAALRAVLKAFAPRRQDTVVTLGNYIDHGPGSQEVVGLLLALG